MHYRPLGRTGPQVSTLSFGASSLGGAFRVIDEGEGIRAVHAPPSTSASTSLDTSCPSTG